jgi:Spirocyclase AveC-like
LTNSSGFTARKSGAALAGAATTTLMLMAWTGAAFIAITIWIWLRWITSTQFRPVDPGPDPIPRYEYLMLVGLQIAGALLTVWLVWYYVIKPRLRTGKFSSDAIIVLVLPLMCFQDPFFNYSQNWFTYNAYLLNMGAWTGDIVPGWLGAHGDRFAEPFVVGYGYLFWIFSVMLFGSWCFDKFRQIWPSISRARFLLLCLLFCTLLDFAIEYACVRVGWYAMPGAWQAVSLHAGTRYQISGIEVLMVGFQTTWWVAFRYFKDDRGYTIAEKGIDSLKLSPLKHFWLRYFAVAGALGLIGLIYTIPIQWQAQHTDVWPPGIPSYFTTVCPEYKFDRKLCGGPGVPMHRPNHIW